jgi:hypothetical protein
MASKVFGDLKGVIVSPKGSTSLSNYINRYSNVNDFKINYLGDPIFIVDIENETIKTYLVKIIKWSYDDYLTLKCCEKGQHREYIPTSAEVGNYTKPFEDFIVVTVKGNKSSQGLVSTTLGGAIKILDVYKKKGCFAALNDGDCLYVVNKDKMALDTLKILRISYNVDSGIYNFRCDDDTRIELKRSYYEYKVSTYNDEYFRFLKKGNWVSAYSYVVFVTKEEAESYLKEVIEKDKKKNTLPKKGTETKLNDSMGNPIHIGDTVAYINGSGFSIKISTAKVINNTKKMVVIFDAESKEALIQQREEYNQRRIKMGQKPYEYDTSKWGIKNIGTNKVLVIKK